MRLQGENDRRKRQENNGKPNESFDYRSQVDAGFFPHDVWLDKPVKPARLLKEVAARIGT
jgi:hypothetical protein